MNTHSPKVWAVAFLEGFSTLAVEVVAIRLAIPVVGSSMTLTGVMLGVVLFAAGIGIRSPCMRPATWAVQRPSG